MGSMCLVEGGFDVGEQKMTKRWAPMTAGSPVHIIASRDGRWIARGTINCGLVTVWAAESQENEAEFRGHEGAEGKVDET